MKTLAGLCMLMPGAAFACALPPSVILTLPTGHYITAAALTVAVTALMGAMAGKLPPSRATPVLERRVWVPDIITSYLSFLCFIGLVLIGLFGARDPMHNLMTLVFWTGVWIAVPLGSMVFGNIWRAVNPWTAPVRIARSLLGRKGSVGLSHAGHWPAVAGYAGFSWFQLVSMSPDDPSVLAQVALCYWLVIFALAVAEGEDWLEQGEFLTVLMGYLAKVSPFWMDTRGARVRLMRGWPGAQVTQMAPLSVSAMAFVTLALSALTFDGLMETFWWHALIGENPLEPTGRSAVIGVNTLGLFGVWLLTTAAIWAVIRLGQAIGGAGFATGPVMLSFLAIAAGYHAAHYLVTLLTAGQYTLAALNDPWFRGDSYLGLPPFYVSFGFLTDPNTMPMIYAAQFALILAAHLLAVLLSLQMAGQMKAMAHLPMTVLMVAYTILGLWLLSTARTG
ncbi:hypothetical protein [Pseudorhodobacter sp. MZDSW-24AT]|uniref:hypothetical protein n=1 Tax=Pseudorhodobacter sp. MZDSW-24AT TaxID=2052957 RepID=UPI000C1E2792|nr:hypothetical protein [Pseudorhodobacter sp. MZDSW-24AT]PJF09935.1 hypothetical protein CUR21_08655 [Pseudorhodobacter sp. MZDSW-24AT]